jgi:DNA-binding transcriptional LysR family regulator
MNLVRLRMFHLAATRGSISEAARELGVTQSAVSKGIARLQEEYGIRLLETSQGRPSPTCAGSALLPLAGKLAELETLAEGCLRGLSRGDSVDVLCSETFGVYCLPPVVAKVRDEWPETRLSIQLVNNGEIEGRISRCDGDVGIVSNPLENPSLSRFHLMDDELVLVCSPDHRLAGEEVGPRELDGEAFLLHEPGSVPRKLAEDFFRRHGIAHSVPLEMSSVETMKSAAREAVGLAFVSRRCVLSELSEGRLAEIPIRGERMRRSFYYVHHRERPTSLAMRRLYHSIRDWAATRDPVLAGIPVMEA